MRVVTRTLNDRGRHSTPTDHPYVRVGATLEVLSIYVEPYGRCDLQLAAPDGHPVGWWDAGMFETVSDDVPPNWVCVVQPDGSLDIAPRSWLRPGFWQDFYDNDPNAVEQYRRETATILGPSRSSFRTGD